MRTVLKLCHVDDATHSKSRLEKLDSSVVQEILPLLFVSQTFNSLL